MSNFFTAGGTLALDNASYVKRAVDDELLELAQKGEFCYVLTPRQMGKSSLMIRTAAALSRQGVKTAILDLTQIGTVTLNQWYLGLLSQLQEQLGLADDPIAWWQAHGELSEVQRFTTYLRQVILKELKKHQIVIFIDEIDSTIKLDFSDDFFAAIRAIYNARATEREFKRLTFIFLGVATPLDLIKDSVRTPFNIGHAITLEDFSRQDAHSLLEGLNAIYPTQAEAIFKRIHHWCNGHPYLTQKLCLTLSRKAGEPWHDEQIDKLVHQLFLRRDSEKETNLQFVQRRLLKHSKREPLLQLYKKVYQGQKVAADGYSTIHQQIKLAGIVKVEHGILKIRNRIYQSAFDLAWIEKHSEPKSWTWFPNFRSLWSTAKSSE